MTSEMELQALKNFLEQQFDLDHMDLPDEYNYTCLPLCLLDAVYSIGVKYASTQNSVKRYCQRYGIPCYKHDNNGSECKHTISDLIQNIEMVGTEHFASDILMNQQRTSSQNGILKAQAVLECAKVFQEAGIECIEDFRNKLNTSIEKKYLAVKGQASGISFRYLCMLCGDENHIKPDRHIVQSLQEHCTKSATADNAEDILQTVLTKLSSDHCDLTLRKLDYVIWEYQSRK